MSTFFLCLFLLQMHLQCSYRLKSAVSCELQGEKKNQAVLIFPVYFMKAVTGPFEGLTNRSLKAATRVSSVPGSFQQSMNGRGLHGRITCCFLRALVEGPRHQTELNSDLGPCNLDYQQEQFVKGYCVRGFESAGRSEIPKANSKKLQMCYIYRGLSPLIHTPHIAHTNFCKRWLNCTWKGSPARRAVYTFLYSCDQAEIPTQGTQLAALAGVSGCSALLYCSGRVSQGWLTDRLNFTSHAEWLISPRLFLFVSFSQTLINLPSCKVRGYQEAGT